MISTLSAGERGAFLSLFFFLLSSKRFFLFSASSIERVDIHSVNTKISSSQNERMAFLKKKREEERRREKKKEEERRREKKREREDRRRVSVDFDVLKQFSPYELRRTCKCV